MHREKQIITVFPGKPAGIGIPNSFFINNSIKKINFL